MGHKNKKQRAENYLPITPPSYYLTRFYYDLKEWIDDGCISADNEKKNLHGFDAGAGLCGNLAIWCDNGYMDGNVHFDSYGSLVIELKEAFLFAGLDQQFPFNQSQQAFLEEAKASACYYNYDRLQWIEQSIARAEA